MMHAVILAGGKGTRLKPYTSLIPKPLVPVGDRAILEILLSRLQKLGVTDVYICLNHFAEIIQAFFGTGDKFGLKITYSREETPLGTVAPIKLIKKLPEDFLVMNGDLLTDLNFNDLYNYHISKKSLLTVASFQRKQKIDFGVLGIDQTRNILIDFQEKPEYSYNVSMGIYVMNKRVLDMIPKNIPFGFDNLLLVMLKNKYPVNIFPYSGYWLDIGRPEDYDKANEEIQMINQLL